jgi:CTD small phosphatase-like protein 2
MDETLMHCNESPDMPADYILPVRFPTGEQIEIRISVRPHVRETLETLAKSFELVVFTASHESYANKVLDTLDPKKEFLNLRFYRDSCFLAEDGLLIKDLRIFANRDLKVPCDRTHRKSS